MSLNIVISLLIIKFMNKVLSIKNINKMLMNIRIMKFKIIFIDKENISFEANEVM